MTAFLIGLGVLVGILVGFTLCLYGTWLAISYVVGEHMW